MPYPIKVLIQATPNNQLVIGLSVLLFHVLHCIPDYGRLVRLMKMLFLFIQTHKIFITSQQPLLLRHESEDYRIVEKPV